MTQPAPAPAVFRCRACGAVWTEQTVGTSPVRTSVKVCGDVFCGGTCDKIPAVVPAPTGATAADREN